MAVTTPKRRKYTGKKNPLKEQQKAAFRDLALLLDGELKEEQKTPAKAGKHTAKLAKIASTPALEGLQRYSALNQLLILEQCPHATNTAGIVTWNERAYKVKKGEKAIYVIAPHERTKPGKEGSAQASGGGGEDTRSVGFHRAPVFDISQVELIDESGPATEYDADAAEEEDMKFDGGEEAAAQEDEAAETEEATAGQEAAD